jgi:UDP-galactopyranose mutase
VDFLKDREIYKALADRVLYTGAIDEYYGYRFGELEYRSLRFEEEVLTGDFQGNAVVNYTDSSVPYTRIIEHKHFEAKSSDKTVISREYPADWSKGKEAYYPLNDAKNTALYERYATLAQEEKSVLFGGRLGLYKYLDMDDTVELALAAAEQAIL